MNHSLKMGTLRARASAAQQHFYLPRPTGCQTRAGRKRLSKIGHERLRSHASTVGTHWTVIFHSPICAHASLAVPIGQHSIRLLWWPSTSSTAARLPNARGRAESCGSLLKKGTGTSQPTRETTTSGCEPVPFFNKPLRSETYRLAANLPPVIFHSPAPTCRVRRAKQENMDVSIP